MDSISPCLILLNKKSNCTKDELNNSIELYIDSKISVMESQIVRYSKQLQIINLYLHGMGIQTKTDPEQKEQQYWSQRRIESNKKLEQFQICYQTVENLRLAYYFTKMKALCKHLQLPDQKSK